MKLIVTTNIHEVIDRLNMAAKEAKPAIVRALNKVIDRVKVRAAREIRNSGYKLKISDIKNAIRINRANPGRLRADAIASGRPIPLMKYNARQVGKGVSVDVLKGRKVIAHAFIATTSNGSKQVFAREPNAKHKKITKGGKATWSALPIRKLYGPSIPDAMASKAVNSALVEYINEAFPAILESEYSYLATGVRRRSPVPAE